MRLHRPNPLLFNVWMEECLRLLQGSPILSDKKVVALVKLQRIADETNTAFGFDDPSTSFSLSELRLQAILRVFDKRMKEWRDSVDEDVLNRMSNHYKPKHPLANSSFSKYSSWEPSTRIHCPCGSSPWTAGNTTLLISTIGILRSRPWMAPAPASQRPYSRAPLNRLTAL